MRSIFVLAFIGLALGCCTANTIEDEANKQLLEQLCSLKRSAPAVTRASEVESLARLLSLGRKSQIKCNENVAQAIKRLKRILDLTNVCSQYSADEIISFWELYVKSKAPLRKHLPRQLKKLFIAYGMQVSKVCKQSMIEHLEDVSKKRDISDMDIDLVTQDTRKRINYFLGDDWRLENLLIVVQKDKPDKFQNNELGKISMEPLTQELFKRIKERCVKKFKPVYFDWITPIVRLAAIGLNYNGDSMRAEMKSFESEKIYRDWFAAIISCEVFLRITVVKVPKLTKDLEGTKKITILDEEDMQELERRGFAREEPQLEPRSYYVAKTSVNDLVLDGQEADLSQSMRRYKSYLSEVNKFQLRMMKKVAKSAKETIDPSQIQWGLQPLDRQFKFTPGQKLLIGIILAASVLTGAIIVGFLFTTGIGQVLLLTFGFCILGALLGITIYRAIEGDSA